MSKTNEKIPTGNTDQNVTKSDTPRTMLYSFTEQGKGKWRVQDDVVMGGRSDSQLKMTDEKRAYFSGRVSLENNGGFCSIHQTVENNPYSIADNLDAFVLTVRGDGKKYNFRVRTPNGRHSYGFTFATAGGGEWETISIDFNKMEAKFRGEPVDSPNYAGEDILEMQLLIGNKKEETFEIYIESIAAM